MKVYLVRISFVQ